MTEVQIRTLVATDLPRLMGTDHSCSSDYVWQLDLHREAGQVSAVFREVRLPRSIRVEYPRNPFALADKWDRQAEMLVAVWRGQPIGYIRMMEQSTSDVVWITDLVVAPEARRRGVATALLQAAQDWSLARGNQRLILEVQSKNEAAIRLAQKIGYEFCGYNDQYYETQDVTLFFGRALK